MDSYFLITLMLLTTVIVASSSRRLPQVREELETSASSHSYSPFEYGKAAQPDLQKWRYYQQQQADAKSFAKLKSHIQPLYPNKLDIQRDGWIPKVVTKSPRYYGVTRKQDLDVQATENYNHNIEYLPSPQYLTGNIVYNQNNQDIAQLSNLLGQKLVQIPNNHQPQYQSQPILSQPQATHLQSELDILSEDNVQKLLQQAQQQAMDQVRLKHDAIEKTRNEAEQAALAKIQAHNSGVADITLESASNVIEEKPINNQAEKINIEPLPIPQALTTSNEDHQSAIDHAVSQAQAYLQQSANIHLYNPTLNDIKFVDVKSTLQTPSNLYPQNYPLKPILNNVKIVDVEPTIPTNSYSYPQNNINTLTKHTEDLTSNNDVITNNINTYVKNIEPIINQVPQKEEIEEINKEGEDYKEDYAVSNLTVKVRFKREFNNSNDTISSETKNLNETISEEIENNEDEMLEELPTPEEWKSSDYEEFYEDSDFYPNDKNVAVYKRVRPPSRLKHSDSRDHEDQIVSPSFKHGSHVKFHVPTKIHTIHHHHDHYKPVFYKDHGHFEDFHDFDDHKEYHVPEEKHHPTYIVINNSNHGASPHGKHKKHPRVIRKRPRVHRKKYSVIDRKVQKAITNLNKFLSRHKIRK